MNLEAFAIRAATIIGPMPQKRDGRWYVLGRSFATLEEALDAMAHREAN